MCVRLDAPLIALVAGRRRLRSFSGELLSFDRRLSRELQMMIDNVRVQRRLTQSINKDIVSSLRLHPRLFGRSREKFVIIKAAVATACVRACVPVCLVHLSASRASVVYIRMSFLRVGTS